MEGAGGLTYLLCKSHLVRIHEAQWGEKFTYMADFLKIYVDHQGDEMLDHAVSHGPISYY